jgi:type VI secretion system protein ImpA
MASPATVDVEALLAPIAGADPAGEPVLFAGPYDEIKEARRSEEGPVGDWQREQKQADWKAVLRIASGTLQTRSKDLQVAAWLTEALVSRHGFAGLRDGLRVLLGLHEQFWDGYHPRVEDGDLSYRVGVLAWINEKLPVTVRDVPITVAGGEHGYSWLRLDESRRVDNLALQGADRLTTALDEGKITGEQFNAAVAGTPRAFYEALAGDLQESQETCDRMQHVVLERFGADAPSLLELRAAIDDCRREADRIVKEKRILEPDPSDAPSEAEGPAVHRAAGGQLPLDPQDRADALRRLGAVAAFFRRTEPHSPVAYLVQRAIKWAEMPLEDWIQDVIGAEDAALARLRETLGIK